MSLNLSNDPVFGHHQPMTIDYLETRVLSGLEGCYRRRIQDEGCDTESDVFVAVVVQQNIQGQEEGSRVLKVGQVKPPVINSKDVWPEAPEAKLTVQPFDLSEFPAVNGLMTSGYVELPFKLKVKEGENWRSVKEGEREAKGYSGLVMRLFLWAKSTRGGEFMVTCLPVALKDLGTLGDKARSRAYPGIKVHKGKFVFSSPELEIQRFGLGTQPFVFVTGLEVEEEGQEVDLSQVNWLQSMAIKKVVCNTLGESVMPNWHNKAGRWREATQKAKFSKLMPPAVWPAPIEEDDLETEQEESSPESEGRRLSSVSMLGAVQLPV